MAKYISLLIIYEYLKKEGKDMVMSKKKLYIIFFTLIFFSCNQSESFVEEKRAKEFRLLTKNLDSIISLAVNKYYTLGNKGRYNRLQFVLGAKSYQRDNIISDSAITSLIKGSDVIEIVFEKANFPPNDPAYGWDGMVKGKKVTPDVFVYMAEVICDNGTPYTYKGNTTLIK